MAPQPADSDSARDAEPSTMTGQPNPAPPFVGLTGPLPSIVAGASLVAAGAVLYGIRSR